jgi:transcriptional regulator GlxA family with amidase domain
MNVAIPIFDRITALDAVGPYEVLSRIPGATVRFLATRPGAKRTDSRMLALLADGALSDVPAPEVIVVPGGYGTRTLMQDEELISWLADAHAASSWTTSVCTGSLLLAAAGVLAGLKATTHWQELDSLREHGVTPVARRVVEQGKVITAAGVSAGIDMALTLAARIAGSAIAQAIQLEIEYDPQPPFDAGSVRVAPPEVIKLARRGIALVGVWPPRGEAMFGLSDRDREQPSV